MPIEIEKRNLENWKFTPQSIFQVLNFHFYFPLWDKEKQKTLEGRKRKSLSASGKRLNIKKINAEILNKKTL